MWIHLLPCIQLQYYLRPRDSLDPKTGVVLPDVSKQSQLFPIPQSHRTGHVTVKTGNGCTQFYKYRITTINCNP